MKFIATRKEFLEFCDDNKVRRDWHEPDEQGFDRAELRGGSFDNCCITSENETHVVLINEDREEQTAINLAMLLAWARGHQL